VFRHVRHSLGTQSVSNVSVFVRFAVDLYEWGPA
jgi:hypothetical protein